MRKIGALILVAAVLMSIASCYRHTFNLGTGAPDGRVAYKSWHPHWVFGIVGDKHLDLKAICPSGNGTIHERTTFWNGLVGALIGFIYYPTTVTIRCADGSQSKLELTEEQAARIVTDPRFLDLVQEFAPERRAEVQVALQGFHYARVRGAEGITARSR